MEPKRFHELQDVGTAKYLVNFHDGVKTHADGSPFFELRIFSNKRKKEKFVAELVKQGYVKG